MSVINQMLKDLDQQQGKKGPAVVQQKPSLPQPPRKYGAVWLVFTTILLGLGISLAAPERFHGWLSQMLQHERAHPAVLPASPQDESIVAGVAGTRPTLANPAQPSASQHVSPEPVVADVSVHTAPTPSATVSDADTARVETMAEAPAAVSAAAEPAAVTAASEPASLAVWPAQPDVDSQLYPATKTASFAEEDVEQDTEVAAAVSSMQVEQVVPDKTTLLQRLSEQAAVALTQGNYQQLTQHAQQYIQLAPADVQGYEWLAESYRQLQQWSSLQQLLQLCAAAQLHSDGLWLQQARLATQQKDWAGTELALSQISNAAVTPDLLQLKANALQQQQKLEAALLAWRQLSTIQPGFSRGWLGQALVLEQLGRTQQAKLAYQQALTVGGLSAASVQFIQQRLAIVE